MPVLSHWDATADTAKAATHCGRGPGRERLPAGRDGTQRRPSAQTPTREVPAPATRPDGRARPGAHLHPLQRLRQAAGPVQQVHVLHVLREALQEAQRLVEGDGHGDLGQLLHGPARPVTAPSPGAADHTCPPSGSLLGAADCPPGRDLKSPLGGAGRVGKRGPCAPSSEPRFCLPTVVPCTSSSSSNPPPTGRNPVARVCRTPTGPPPRQHVLQATSQSEIPKHHSNVSFPSPPGCPEIP